MTKTPLTHNWYFTLAPQKAIPGAADKTWKKLSLPHTWNGIDGQDGGGDYTRCAAWYLRELNLFPERARETLILYFEAAAHEATVYLNGMEVTRHKGGYSAFTADITPFAKEGKNTLCVRVSNEKNDHIYPQMADFTFYGGLTRPVTLLRLPETHFDFGSFASSGFRVNSEIAKDGSALLHLRAAIKNADEADTIRYTLTDAEGLAVIEAYTSAKNGALTLTIPHVHLWHGITDPYLYTARAELIRHNEVLDTREARHGFRFFGVDGERGFLLNGKPYPLRGVSRHGDKLARGTALSEEDHLRDMEILRELGANCVRLAHYQHDERFLTLCDQNGLIVWAEIPYISKMLPHGLENAMTQLNELIAQQYNHSAICFWGIANEITIGGEPEGLMGELETLNTLAKSLDPSRLTTIAAVSMLPKESPQNFLTDALAYNHYFGWYGGELSDNEAWLDAFHKQYKERPLGLSEYGCEGILTYHSDTPARGDYTEEYQALYHEHMLRIIGARPWLWGTFVWNLFDFGCDARDEGGVMGRNNKGLVTFDRRIKKDAFYLYKAHWSKEPMVHLAGKRFAVRGGKTITVKAYSNEPMLTLSINGIEIDKRLGGPVFVFEKIPVSEGTFTVTVSSGKVQDTMLLTVAPESPAHYTLKKEDIPVTNWFEGKTAPADTTLRCKEGFFSVKNTLSALLGNEKTAEILLGALRSASGMEVKASQLLLFADTTPEEMMKNPAFSSRANMPPETLLALLNEELQRIPKD